MATSLRVKTTNGLIGGHPAPNRTSVAEFLGIKYAAAPIGELRFAPPKRFAAPPRTFFEASEWVSVLMRITNFHHGSTALIRTPYAVTGLRVWKNFAAQNDNTSSEDCLALNVWTKNPGISAKKPALVWFHGGRFTIPGPHSPFFDGEYLADAEDVIVVTLPTRHLRFPRRSGNAPSRITIFGQSAGGASVDYYSFAWTKDPTIDNATVFADYETRAAAGRFARIPLLVGNNDFEAGWYKLSAWAARINLTEAQWDLYDERAFTCPSAYTAGYRVRYGVPTWRYRYFGDWDNLRLYNGSAGLGPRGSGAYHGSEIEMVFGTVRDVSGLESSCEEDVTSRYMMAAWAAFARDPTGGLTTHGWPLYDPTDSSLSLYHVSIGDTLVLLGYQNSPEPSFVAPNTYDSHCPVKNDPLPGRGAF
ncbi:cholinesterase precursor [Apiospora aurea]|uniref:Cholinesterase n=1 Tax=Apiospora aurea TaxID=335848 RepID=A0ABR1QMR5_9PEZI